MSVPDYYSRVNRALLEVIPPDAKVILEIGCGAGALCEAYRRINPGVKWDGVEADLDACDIATKSGINVFAGDIEQYDWWELTPGTSDHPEVDCLIFGDVLEHLIDPLKVLKKLAYAVRPGGQILASIPNVAHYVNILNLTHGHWTYTEEGTLDRTHLRFFTLESIHAMFVEAGLQIFEVRNLGTADNPELERWNRYAKAIQLGQQAYAESLAFQYLVRAAKPSMEPWVVLSEHAHFDSDQLDVRHGEMPSQVKPLHIHHVGDGTVCERVRLLEPMAALATIPGVRCTFDRGWIRPGEDIPNVLIQQRLREMVWHRQKQLCERALVIAEFDDEPAHLQGVSDQDFAPLRAVHAVQVSTERMRQTCLRYNSHVEVFENQIADLPPLVIYPPGGEITLVYAALNRENDWAPIMDALNCVLADHPLVTVRVVNDQAFYDALETDNKKFIPFCDYATYRAVLRSADIALLPLEPSPSNEHKSDLKFIECAAEGVACMAGETVYRSISGYDTGEVIAWIYSDVDDFEHYLRRLIREPTTRHRITVDAYSYVRDHRLLSQHYRKRHEWYLSLLSRKEELQRDLLSRCPELRS